MAKTAIVLLAEGFEEIEAVTVIDTLRRAGIRVTTAGIGSRKIKGSRDISIEADKTLEEAGDAFDAVILPGGMPGAANLSRSKNTSALIKKHFDQGKLIAAICAAPSVVLAPLGILKGRSVTGYPGMTEPFGKETAYKEDKVVIDGNIITSRGPATALAFALAIAEILAGKETSEKLKKAMLVE